jgi:hypothetical protein
MRFKAVMVMGCIVREDKVEGDVVVGKTGLECMYDFCASYHLSSIIITIVSHRHPTTNPSHLLSSPLYTLNSATPALSMYAL